MIRLADIFADNMVLQRGKEICIYGTGKGQVSIEFAGQVHTFVSEGDTFRFYLPALEAGGPYDMRIDDGDVVYNIRNILIGDVYIAAGQSNIELELNRTAEIEIKDNENIRYFTEPNFLDRDLNKTYVNKGWRACNEESAMEFSAIGHYFSEYLYKETGVPIGIVSCNKGASRIETWTAPEVTESAEYTEYVKVRHADYRLFKFNQNNRLYRHKLLNIVPFAASGVLWYQGESDRGYKEGYYYDKMFEKLVENWRDIWNCHLPFYTVQIAPFKEDSEYTNWAEVRASQERAAKTIDDVYLITLARTNEETMIHPMHKKGIAQALCNAVLDRQFGRDLEYSGPVFDSVTKTESGADVTFTHADGLYIDGEKLTDTYAVDRDGERHEVSAKADGNTLHLTWDKNAAVDFVEMGFCNVPTHNLYNKAGYLASPFKITIG